MLYSLPERSIQVSYCHGLRHLNHRHNFHQEILPRPRPRAAIHSFPSRARPSREAS